MIASRLGLPVPEEPDDDPITTHVVTVYQLAARARRAIVGPGGAVQLLPLTVADITEVLSAHYSPLSRAELDPAVFALDAIDRSADTETEETDNDE